MRWSLPDLPVQSALPALKAALADAGCAVLAAPPGSGKTTLVPLALLDEPWIAGQRIVMLEPRRVAARAAAARMSFLAGEPVGGTIGYQIRFERRIGRDTRIEVVTEGLLARRLQADPELPGVGLLIFDEFHERSLDADLALALALDVRANLKPALRLLVMSATLDSARVARLLGDAQVVATHGQLYPVDIEYAAQRSETEHGEAVANGVLTALDAYPGDVLAFLPGAREIRTAQRRLEQRAAGVQVFPLYGELSSEQQDLALQPARDGERKVILATNIAQTSLTVEGVTSVVDGGLVRVARFDLGAGANRLETQRVSRAAADQRAGRAGRLGPGRCWRLWSRDQHASLVAHDTPEILAADLSRFALELAHWGTSDPAQLAFLDLPASANWSCARELLAELGALDADGRINAHGRELVRLPTAPRRAHMLLRARDAGLAGLACWVAAVLDERERGESDLAALVQRYLDGRGADEQAQRRVREGAGQLARTIQAPARAEFDERAVARLASWTYPERIARRREPARGAREIAYLCEDGGEARLPEHEPLAQSPWLAIAHWDPGPPRRPRLAVRIDEADLLRDHAERLRTVDEVRWDAQDEAVIAERQRRLGAIVLERRPLRELAGDAARAAMLDGIRQLGVAALPWTESARQWQARVMSLRAWRPQEDWPDVGDAALLATLADWLGPQLEGVTRRAHLARLELGEIFAARFDYATRQQLDRLAPTHLAVPTGSRLLLDYQPPNAPALAVRLQELFGSLDTPTVNEGRTRVVLQLLSPARRTIAITQDLAGFWARGYADVRKDMKGQYPKHPWPDDPRLAAPTRRAKPRP